MHRFLLNIKCQTYLKGFLKCKNRPKMSKFSQKCAQNAHDAPAFTVFALSVPRGHGLLVNGSFTRRVVG
jgi:hypothetical protein